MGAATAAVAGSRRRPHRGRPPVAQVDTRAACGGVRRRAAVRAASAGSGRARGTRSPATTGRPTAGSACTPTTPTTARARSARSGSPTIRRPRPRRRRCRRRRPGRRRARAAVVDRGGAAAVMHDAGTWRASPARRRDGRRTAGARSRAPPAAPAPSWRRRRAEHVRWPAMPRARPDPGHRRTGVHPVPRRPRCRRAAARPAGLRRGRRARAGRDARQALRRPRPRRDDDRARFVELVAAADVVVHGLRPGAMEGLGFGPAELRSLNPGLVTARLDAYGWAGPWAGAARLRQPRPDELRDRRRRWRGAGVDRPVPVAGPGARPRHRLPAGGRRRAGPRPTGSGRGAAADVTASLLGTANVLLSLPTPGGLDRPAPEWGAGRPRPTSDGLGTGRAVPSAGGVAGWPASYDRAGRTARSRRAVVVRRRNGRNRPIDRWGFRSMDRLDAFPPEGTDRAGNGLFPGREAQLSGFSNQ